MAIATSCRRVARYRIAFKVFLLRLVISVVAFIPGKYSHSRYKRHRLPIEKWSGLVLAQTQIKQNTNIYEDEHPNIVHPANTLQNIGINITQSLAPDVAYFYLLETLGLPEETMWKITLEAGSILGMTPRNLEKKVSLLRRTMNLSDEDVRVILGRQPAVLHYSAERNLAPTILYLVRAFDLSKSDLRKIVMDCPSILGYSLGNLGSKVSFFKSLGYSDEDSLRELIVCTPRLLLSAVESGLMPRMKFLLNEIQFSLNELRNMVQKNPRLLLYSLDGNLREKIVFFFILQLQIELEDVRKMMLTFPRIMDYNLENTMKPIAEYFTTELEFSPSELGSIVVKFPRLFSYSLFKIKHVAGFLKYELGLDPHACKRVIFQAPQVLGLDTEGNLKAKLHFLRDRIKLTAEELGLVFSKMPTVACLGIETNMLPKLDYFERTLSDFNEKEQILREIILKQPCLLGYSLQGRIKPRMEQIVDAGISPKKISVGISMSEAAFQKWLSSSKCRKMKQRESVRQTATASDILLKELNISKSDLLSVGPELQDLNDWSEARLRTWIGYLKGELGVANDDLKNVLLFHPTLLDRSLLLKNKSRIKKLSSAGHNLLESLHTISLPGIEFDGWVKSFRSRIGFLRRELKLNDDESHVLISEMPTLQRTQTSNKFKEKIQYFMSEFSPKDVKMLLLRQPSILKLSINKSVEPRMQKIRQASISDPQRISDLICMKNNDFAKWSRQADTNLDKKRSHFFGAIEFLKSALELNHDQTDSLLLSLPDSSTTRKEVEIIVNFLLSLAEGDMGIVRATLLEKPHLLSVAMGELKNNANQTRLLLQRGTKTRTTQAGTDHKNLLFNTLQRSLNFTQKEMCSINAGLRWKNIALDLGTQIDFLLSCGSEDQVKNAILSRPKLLLYSLSELQNISNVFATRSMKTPFRNESGSILRDILGMSEETVDCVLSYNRYLLIRDPEAFLTPKLGYLLSAFGGCKEYVSKFILGNPGVLDHSLDWITSRMKIFIDAGLDLAQGNEVMILDDHGTNGTLDMQVDCNLTSTELDRLMSKKAWLLNPRLRRLAGPTVKYLASQFNGSIDDLEKAILQEPKLLTLPLSKTRKVMDMLLNSGCPPGDISKAVMLSERKVEHHCLKCYLCKRLDLQANQIDWLFASVLSNHQSPRSLQDKIDFILDNVVGGSEHKVKVAILEDPAFLKKSLKQIIEPRAEVMHLLEPFGIECNLDDLFTLSQSAFTKVLIPKFDTWHPPDNDLEGPPDSNLEGNFERDMNDIINTLKDFSSESLLTYSDESNRENARIVHWK